MGLRFLVPALHEIESGQVATDAGTRVDRQSRLERPLGLLAAARGPVIHRQRLAWPKCVWGDFHRSLERRFRGGRVAATGFDEAEDFLEPGLLRQRLDGPLENRARVTRVGLGCTRISQQYQGVHVLRVAFEHAASPRCRVFKVTGEQQQAARVELHLAIVRHQVGGSDALAQSLRQIIRLFISECELIPHLSEPVVQLQSLAVLDDCRLVFAVGGVLISLLQMALLLLCRARTGRTKHGDQRQHREGRDREVSFHGYGSRALKGRAAPWTSCAVCDLGVCLFSLVLSAVGQLSDRVLMTNVAERKTSRELGSAKPWARERQKQKGDGEWRSTRRPVLRQPDYQRRVT